MKRVLVAAVLGLATLAAAAAAYLWTLDPDDYRTEILAELERRTGRTATLGAPIELSLSLRPAVVLREFTLGGDPRDGGAAMVTVRRAEGEADLLQLLRGELSIRRLELIGAQVTLQAYGGGGGNWEFPSIPRAADAAAPARVALARAQLSDSSIRYLTANGAVTTLHVDQLDIEPAADGTRIAFDLRGRLDDLPFTAAGQAGRIAALLSDPAPWPVDTRIALPGAEAQLTGTLAGPLAEGGMFLQLDLRGPDLAPLAAWLQVALPRGLPWSVTATLQGSGEDLTLDALAAALGDNRVRGALRIARAGARPRVSGNLHAERLDLLQLAGAAPEQGAGGARKRLFSEQPFDLSLLRALDAELELSGDAVLTPLGELSALLAQVTLDDGALAIAPLDLRLADSRVQGGLHVETPAGGVPLMRLELDARQVDVAPILRRFGQEPLLEGRADLRAALSGAGASPAALAGSLDGRLRLLMVSGRGRLSLLEDLVGGVTKLLGDVAKRDSDEWAAINCLAADFGLGKGIARRELLLLDTESMTVVGDGSIDLGRELLDLELSPRPKSVTLNLSLAVDVGGTLLEPTFTANTASAARRVGSLLGGLLFPPAALAAFADFGVGEDKPCAGVAAGSPPARRNQSDAPARRDLPDAPAPAPPPQPRAREAMN